jgi:hypothetical protein
VSTRDTNGQLLDLDSNAAKKRFLGQDRAGHRAGSPLYFASAGVG